MAWQILIFIILLLLIPYSYIVSRFISKGWFKSKNEECNK